MAHERLDPTGPHPLLLSGGQPRPPILSVVIPALNEEARLGRSLDAVLKSCDRTRARCEVLVVDNGSKDRTVDIARSFAEVRVIQEPTKGVDAARSRGLHSATTDNVVVSTDADCIPPPDWLVTMLEEFDDPSIVGVCGDVEYDKVHPLYTVMNGIRIFARRARAALGSERAKHHVNFTGQNSSFRRADALAVGGYKHGIQYGEDWVLGRELEKRGRVIQSHDPRMKVTADGRRFQRPLPIVKQAIRKTYAVAMYKLTGKWPQQKFDDVR